MCKLLGVLGLVVGIAATVACDSRPVTTTSTTPTACPQCECKCACPATPQGTATSTPTTSPTSAGSEEEIEELTYNVSRKIAKRDATCVADFERLGEIAPKVQRRMAFSHGQCLMVAGKCEAGTAMVRKEMLETTEIGPTQVDRAMDTYVSMYCSGPLDERGELLRALTQLQKGGYQENIGIRACTDAAKTISRLKGRVRPKDDEDHQVKTIGDTFGPMGAACFARAGDCASAWRIYNDEFVATHLASIADPKIRAETARQTFDSMVPKCTGRP